MPRSKISPEEVVISYFEEKPLDQVQMLLNIVKGRVAKRERIINPSAPKRAGRPPSSVSVEQQPLTISESA